MSTNAELASIRGALSHLTHSRDWHQVTIVTDSQAAIQMIRCIDWRRCRTSVHSIHQSIQALMAQGRQVQLWWVPGHQGILGNERANAAARAALEASRTTSGEYAMLRGPCWRGQFVNGIRARSDRRSAVFRDRTWSQWRKRLFTRIWDGPKLCLLGLWVPALASS